jgi:hypothetical protein
MRSNTILSAHNLDLALLAVAADLSATSGSYAAIDFLQENGISLELAVSLLGCPALAIDLLCRETTKPEDQRSCPHGAVEKVG